MTLSTRRVPSIDAFRALTMFLMIFVNDLGSLTGIPGWLEHAAKTEDRMGLADAVFPAFLFIVGLSIPLSLKAREIRGYSRRSNLVHILTRSLALLVMGFFHVNLENYDKSALLPKPLWEIGITFAFFLVWLDYRSLGSLSLKGSLLLKGSSPPEGSLSMEGSLPAENGLGSFPIPAPRLATGRMEMKRAWILRVTGIVLLVVLALLYRGVQEGPEGGIVTGIWMRPQWYGILGLIGWCYLLCACIYLFAGDKLTVLSGALLFFLAFRIVYGLGWLSSLDPIKNYVWLVSSGALPALTMAGAVTSVMYRERTAAGRQVQSLWIILMMAIGFLAAGFALRHTWAISKIRASPSWVLICTAISLGCFLVMIFIVDIKKKENWFKWLKPAGTSTLTCYLLPYIHYAILSWLGPQSRLPMVLRTGGIGILKCLIYAWVIILITGWLEKKKIRLVI